MSSLLTVLDGGASGGGAVGINASLVVRGSLTCVYNQLDTIAGSVSVSAAISGAGDEFATIAASVAATSAISGTYNEFATISGSVAVTGDVTGSTAGDAYMNQAPQAFEITIANGQTTGTATITEIAGTGVITGCHTEYVSGTSEGNDELQASVTLTNATTITAKRHGTTGAMTVRGAILDAASTLVASAQYAEVTFTNETTLTKTAAISEVVLANSVIISLGQTYEYGAATILPGRSIGMWDFNSTTEIEFSKGAAVASHDTSHACVVVEFNSSAIESLQKVTFSGDVDGSGYSDETISAVTLANTALFSGGYVATSASTDGWGLAAYTLSSTTNARLISNTTYTNNHNGTLWVVEFVSGVLTSSNFYSHSIGTSTSSADTITSVTVANATITNLGSWANQTTSVVVKDWAIGLEITAATTVTFTNGSSGNINDETHYQVLEWVV